MRVYFFPFLLLSLIGYGLWYFPELEIFSSHPVPASRHTQVVFFQGVAMTMPYRISVEAPLSESMRAKCEEVIARSFNHIDQIFNRYNPNSQISIFNDLTNTEPMRVNPELYKLMVLADELWKISHGIYDPTVNSATQVWRKYLQKGKIPPFEEREKIENSVGWQHIRLHEVDQISKDSADVKMDLNSIAKGYAVDLITESLKELGLKHLFVEWAGEVRVYGGHPSHRHWVIGIKTPRKDNYSYLAKIELMNGAVASSGHDELFWVAEDDQGQLHNYSHLMNSLTKRPLKIEDRQILSCTVLASSCLLADGLSTTGLLFDNVEEAQKWATHIIHKWPDISIFFFTKDQQLWHLSGNTSKAVHTIRNVELYHPIEVK